VLVPALPGALSAYGILVSDVVKDYSRTVIWRAVSELPWSRLQAQFDRFRRAALADFRRERWPGRPRFEPSVDVRYRGQGYELNVPFSARLLDDFHREHNRRYGYSRLGREVELVTLRLRARIPGNLARVEGRGAGSGNPLAARGKARAIFGGRTLAVPVYDRDSLRQGRSYRGPAIVAEYGATTAVPPGMRFRVDSARNLLIEMPEQ